MAPKRLALAIIALILVFFTVAVGTASAHANLVKSEPEAGAVLDTAPTVLRLWFSETPELAFSKVQLLDRGGNPIAGVGSLRVDASDDTLLSATLPPLKPGIYTVTWHTASAVDGHVTTGGFAFVVGHDPALVNALVPQSSGNPSGTSDVPIPASVIRWVSYLGLALMVGGFAFVPLIAQSAGLPPDFGIYRVLILGWILITAASLAGALLEASNTGTDLLNLLVLTRFGSLFALRIVVLLAIGALLIWRGKRGDSVRWWYAGLMLGGALLLVVSLNSHADALTDPTFPVIADFLHIAAMCVWLGGLVLLFLALRHIKRTGDSAQISLLLVRRFSDVATICVATLGVTGLIQVFFQVGDLYNLLITSYGLALLVKLLVIVPLLALGAVNLYTTRRKIVTAIKASTAGDVFPRPVQLVMRSVTGEIVLICIVLGATGILTNLPPAREAFGSGAVAHAQVNDLNIVLTANPGLPGLNTFDIYVKDSLFRPATDIQKVELNFGMLEHDMGTEQATATQVGDGHYVVQGSYVSMIGTWNMEVVVRRTGQFDARTTLTLPVLALKQPSTSPVLLAPSRAIMGLAILIISALLFGAAWRIRRTYPRVQRMLAVIGALTIILGLAIGSTGFSSGMSSILIEENPVAADAASLQRGQQLYADNCLACHGATGAGDGPVGISLKPQPSDLRIPLKVKYTDGQLFDLITRGIPSSTMPGFGMNLTEQDRWDVINYIENFSKGH